MHCIHVFSDAIESIWFVKKKGINLTFSIRNKEQYVQLQFVSTSIWSTFYKCIRVLMCIETTGCHFCMRKHFIWLKSMHGLLSNDHKFDRLQVDTLFLFKLNDVYLVWIERFSEWTVDWTHKGAWLQPRIYVQHSDRVYVCVYVLLPHCI